MKIKFFKRLLHGEKKPSTPTTTTTSNEDSISLDVDKSEKNGDMSTDRSSSIQIEWNLPLPPGMKIDDRVSNTFNDGLRSIDYALVYESDSSENDLTRLDDVDDNGNDDDDQNQMLSRLQRIGMSEKEARKRRGEIYRLRYLKNLKQTGLELELDVIKSDKKFVKFVKIHIPWRVLVDYAEELNFQVPINIKHSNDQSLTNKLIELNHVFSPDQEEESIQFYTCLFRKSKVNKYIPSRLYPAYFSNTQRQTATHEILQSTRYGRIERGEMGIYRLIREDVFSAAFPLHDACEADDDSPRARLAFKWARFAVWYKHQPLDQIRDYFGEKIGLYFAWLGAYTAWLLLPSVVGLCVFVFGLIVSFYDTAVKEVCTIGQNITMCPLCDQCQSWSLSDICFQAQTSVVFDNAATMFYAVFMSFWAVCFLEYWKRKNITLAYQWNCVDYEQEDERPRSEFVIKADITRRNPVTGKEEPGFTKSKRHVRMLVGFTTIIFMVMIVIIFMFAIIIYKTFVNLTLFKNNTWLKKYASNISSLTGAVFNLIVILILGRVYQRIAHVLTEWEMHETQTEFENHLTFKVFAFEFVNFYSSIFYIAFVKGKFVGYPGHYTSLYGYRQEDCDNGGCLIELSQQFAIIMIGKQMINNVQEFILPKLKGMLQKFMVKFGKNSTKSQLEKDYELPNHDGLFDEYLEMVLQFGFITSFVAAFPLGPLFALLNNWIEIRLDASKLVSDTRRPLSQRASNIGVWHNIVETLVTIAVICNGFLIAFTSDYLPRLLYQTKNNWRLDGYVEFSLAYSPPGTSDQTCRYRGFRDEEGNFSEFFWQLLVFRLCFVIIFELIEVAVPDIPENLALKIKRERYLAKKALQDAI